MPVDEDLAAASRRDRIVAAAARLLEEGGSEAVSTRRERSSGVQAPTIYRLFGDKQGLLDAVASAGFAHYLASKTGWTPSDDPVDDLRAGWDLHVELGVANPALYRLMYDQDRPSTSPAALAAMDVLAGRIHRIAEAGRLRIGEGRAVELVHAAGHGTTLTLIAMAEHDRDLGVSALARDAIIDAITTDTPEATAPDRSGGLINAAVTLRALLPHSHQLTGPERALMQEWLDRIADHSPL